VDDGRIDEAHGKAGEGMNEYIVQEIIKIQTFHIANIQNLLTKTERGEIGMFLRKIDKNKFLETNAMKRTHFP